MATPTPTSLVAGTLPEGVHGRLLAIGPDEHGDGVVHCVDLAADRAPSYRRQCLVTAAGAGELVAADLVVFGESILAVGNGSLAYELTSGLAAGQPVDLAGQARGLASCPRLEATSGDLHLVTVGEAGAQAHVTVSAGALTRRARRIAAAPARIADLVVARDHVVFAASRFIGVASRCGSAPATWTHTCVDGCRLVAAHDADDTVVVMVLTPALERWIIDVASSVVTQREVLDRSARRFAATRGVVAGGGPRYVWTTGDDGVRQLDLAAATDTSRRFAAGVPGDLRFVDDSSRPGDARGWLVGFVHHPSANHTDVVGLDDITLAPIFTVRIPRRIPTGLRATWIPDPARHNQGDRS